MCASPAPQCPRPVARLRPSAQPDALAPRSRDTLNNLIVKSPQDWQTGVGLPFFAITGTVVEWDECAAAPSRLGAAHCSPLRCVLRIRFDVRLMQRVPYGAIAVNDANPCLTDALLRLTPPLLLGLRRGRVAHADVAAPQVPRSRSQARPRPRDRCVFATRSTPPSCPPRSHSLLATYSQRATSTPPRRVASTSPTN